MSLEKPNEKQMQLLKKLTMPNEEWAKDIIWLKRMDAVSNSKQQREADKLFETIIKMNKLFSKDELKFKLISEKDNVWDSQRQNE